LSRGWSLEQESKQKGDLPAIVLHCPEAKMSASAEISDESGKNNPKQGIQELRDSGPRIEEDVEKDAAEKVAGLLERCKALQDAATAHATRIKYDSQSLSQQATTLVSDINSLRKYINTHAHEKDEINHKLAEKVSTMKLLFVAFR
jgi:predicted  nucleic acid-binding Zn-ribbon protein